MTGFQSHVSQDVPPFMLVDGNPLKDLSLLTKQGAHLPLIMQGGRMHKNQLS